MFRGQGLWFQAWFVAWLLNIPVHASQQSTPFVNSPESSANEIKKSMRDFISNGASDPSMGDPLDLEKFKHLAQQYGILANQFKDQELEALFVRAYLERVAKSVLKANRLVGVFRDTVEELGLDRRYWKEESYQEKWSVSSPYRWFGSQWQYMSEHATDQGKKLLLAASKLSVQINETFFEVRSFLPQQIDSSESEFLMNIYRITRETALVNFSEEVDAYLLEREGFLGLRAEIVEMKKVSCAQMLSLAEAPF